MLQAQHSGLHDAEATLAAAARNLSSIAAGALPHPPLAADEVSSSAAARLTEHGAVLTSRAADGAAVLESAAQAVAEASRAYRDVDRGNASVVALRGDPGSDGAAMNPAVTINAPTPYVPITPSPPRDGEVSAGILEAGNAESGTGFVSGCTAQATVFRDSAVAARTAQAVVSESLIGQAGPRIAAALGRFAEWADEMATHASTVAAAAAGHKGRYQIVRHDTPATSEFDTKKRELANAEMLYQRYPAVYGPVVAQKQSELMALHRKAGMAAASYHMGELPAAPPPPPPVVPVVGGSAPAPNRPPSVPSDNSDPAHMTADAGTGETPAGDGVDAGLEDPATTTDAAAAADAGLTADSAGDPAGHVTEMAPMAAMLPGMLAGALGGVIGMAASVPQQIGQQVQSIASQAAQGVSGLASGLAQPDAGDLNTSSSEPNSLGDVGSGGAGGGGGTDPAASPAQALPPGGSGMLASAAPSAGSTPVGGQASTASGAPPPPAGPAGMVPFMPMGGMGGVGGSDARQVKDPDKKIFMPPEPNSEPVKGEVMRRETAVADDPTDASKRKPAVSVSVSSSRCHIGLPKDNDGGGGSDGV